MKFQIYANLNKVMTNYLIATMITHLTKDQITYQKIIKTLKKNQFQKILFQIHLRKNYAINLLKMIK